MMRAILLLAALALAGCSSVPRVEVQEVKVPVPVECREPVPDRPAMPTEALADDADAVMLQGRLSGLARDRRPFALPLRVALLGDFLALIPDGDTRDIDALARGCVSHLHALAAPLSPAELARRRAAGLSPDEDKMLQRWGYPYVMDHFRLHFSLTGSLRNVDAETIDALREAAEHCFAALPPLRVDAVSVFAEPTPGADFLFIDRMELGA